MKTHLLAVTALLVTAATCWARLGENEAQSITRYGQPVNTFYAGATGEVRHDYWKDGFLVKAVFFHGVCCSISFKKATMVNESPDDAYKDQGLKLTESEIILLLKENNQSRSWTKASDDSGGDVWSRDDGGAAFFDRSFFYIESPDFVKLMKLIEAANQNSDSAHAKKSVGGL